MKNFEKKVLKLNSLIEYQENSIVSKTIATNGDTSLTLFAFDNGQSIDTHSAPVDALVECIEGEVEITISGKKFKLKDGEAILMPKGEPHGLEAISKFKMLLFKI